MIVRTVGFAAVLAAAIVPSCQPACEPPPPAPPPPTEAPPPPPPHALTVVVDGTGNGHGRGLSQWGSYGWAVNYGRTWDQILAHYYGGTRLGGAANSAIRVRLVALDEAPSTGVISTNGSAMWNGTGYAALEAFEVGDQNRYEIWGSSTPRCPGAPEGWTYLQTVTGPVTFTTPVDQTTGTAGDVLGVCQPDGTVVHYRGTITALNDGAGANRTVNEVLIENYLRGVVPRESPSSWGNAGNRAGMHALRAQAVAARSFAFAQHRYSYAKTCDTSTCQVYGGAAHRAGPAEGLSGQACEAGNPTRECANTNAAVADTAGSVVLWPDGRVVSTEFSASNGPRTAGGAFPPVDDPADDVPGNPYHRWTVELDAAVLAAHYGLGELQAAVTERDPASPYDGIWGNRVVLTGSAGTVVVSAWDFRNLWGLRSPGFVIRGVTWSA